SLRWCVSNTRRPSALTSQAEPVRCPIASSRCAASACRHTNSMKRSAAAARSGWRAAKRSNAARQACCCGSRAPPAVSCPSMTASACRHRWCRVCYRRCGAGRCRIREPHRRHPRPGCRLAAYLDHRGEDAMIFWRVKPLDKIIETAEKKSLKRQLGPIQLTLLGIGAVIGTGIFVLTAEAGQKAGPGMMLAFVIAAIVCGLAALAYAELAAMVPVSGSAYTYSYGVLGEFIAWVVGWALGLEYGIGAAVVCVGWSGYMNGLLAANGYGLPEALRTGLYAGGSFNLLAFLIGLAVTVLLVIGTSKSARVNAVLVAIKIAALTAFVIFAFPAVKSSNFTPFLPGGWGSPLGGVGVLGAAASIFFAYVGFDAVSTAAEETKNPNRNIPIGLIGSLTICTIFYLLVGYSAAGSVGAQPILGPNGMPLDPGTPEMTAACVDSQALVCSKEPLAHVLR